MTKPTPAQTIINAYTTRDDLIEIAVALHSGRCQYMPVHWAADALAEALLEAEGDDYASVREQEDELLAAWAQYVAAAEVVS